MLSRKTLFRWSAPQIFGGPLRPVLGLFGPGRTLRLAIYPHLSTFLLPLSSFSLPPRFSILNPQSAILSPQSSALSPIFSVLNPQSPILSPQSSALSPLFSIRNPQSAIPNPQYSVLSTQHSVLSSQSSLSPSFRKTPVLRDSRNSLLASASRRRYGCPIAPQGAEKP